MSAHAMKRRLTAIVLLLLPMIATAAESDYPLDEMVPDLHDKASLQRGAKTYLNYCMGCHSLQYQRYIRTADDLGIPHDLMLEHMIFDPDVRIGALMENSISIDNAKNWFGAAPPDLTMYSQLKGGPAYLYSYLRGFYEDPARPFGVNNTVFENVGMPHVLVDLQGLQRYVCEQVPKLDDSGAKSRDRHTLAYVTEEKCGAELKKIGRNPLEHKEGTGTLSPEEYDQVVYDLSNFLYYTSEPVRLERQRIGVYVLLFLAFFYGFTYLLGREYTKEFH
jgi:ubiquinol-cytochrome c reductase cytochrome c1 subunit